MFCQECGAKNSDDSIFCQECGTRLDKVDMPVNQQVNAEFNNQPAGEQPQNGFSNQQMNQQAWNNFNGQQSAQAVKPIPKLWIAIAGEIVAILVMAIVFKGVVEERFSADKTAEQYFASLVNGDYEKAYDMLELPDSELLTEKLFVKSMKQNTLGEVTDYKVSVTSETDGESDKSSKGLSKSCYVSYRIKGSDEENVFVVTLTKDSKKKFLFFNQWLVTSSSVWDKDTYLSVPKGTKVKIDGVDVSKNLKESTEYLDEYDIPYIFAGVHEIEVSAEDMETVKETFDSGSGYVLSGMNYSEEAIKELQTLAKDNMKKIYAAAAAGAGFDSIKDLFTSDAEKLTEIQNDYVSLKENLTGENFISLDIDKVTASSWNTSTDVELGIQGALNYYYHYFFSDKKTKEKSELDRTLYMSFVKEDGKWVQNNIGCSEFYY